MKTKELKIQNFINTFNEDFKTKLEIKDTGFLVDLFENFVSIQASYSSNKKDLESIVELEEKIYSSLNVEQKNQFDMWNRLQDKYFYDMEDQAFVYGFCTCKQLNEETKI